MKVAVAGPTGVLGRNLIPQLIKQGHRVLALARSIQKAELLLPEDIDIVSCDLLDSSMDEQLPGILEGFDAVIHIATAIPDDFSSPGAWETNSRLRTEGTKRLLASSLKAGVSKYLQQSIVMAYPDHQDNWITEDQPLDESGNRKQVCKPVITMESMIREIPTDQLAWTIIRGGVFVGKDTFQDHLIKQLRNGQATIPCDGSHFVSYVHVEDMADAFVRALDQASSGMIFNICDEPVQQRDYLELLTKHLGIKPLIKTSEETCPPSHRCSNEKAISILGWRPVHGILPEADQMI
jgi:nucleoside-diphosphate-sugar epimerase